MPERLRSVSATDLAAAVQAHLQSAGVPDAAQQAADFAERSGRGDNDAQLWGALSVALAGTLSTDRRQVVARQVVAILRRVREPARRTWAPGDELPSPPPAKIVDLDGATWLHQTRAGHGCYRMSSKDRAKYGIDGVQLWPFLLDAEGPFTEAPGRVR
jgi:hypothetical protein